MNLKRCREVVDAVSNTGRLIISKAENSALLYEMIYGLSKIEKAIESAHTLRTAQRVYLENRGNEELGKAVGTAATALDVALAALEKQ